MAEIGKYERMNRFYEEDIEYLREIIAEKLRNYFNHLVMKIHLVAEDFNGENKEESLKELEKLKNQRGATDYLFGGFIESSFADKFADSVEKYINGESEKIKLVCYVVKRDEEENKDIVVHGSITYNPKEMEDCFDEIELEPEIMYVEEDYNALRKYFKDENQHHFL